MKVRDAMWDWDNMNSEGRRRDVSGVGELFSAKGNLDTYNIIPVPYKLINLKITLI